MSMGWFFEPLFDLHRRIGVFLVTTLDHRWTGIVAAITPDVMFLREVCKCFMKLLFITSIGPQNWKVPVLESLAVSEG